MMRNDKPEHQIIVGNRCIELVGELGNFNFLANYDDIFIDAVFGLVLFDCLSFSILSLRYPDLSLKIRTTSQ